MATIKITQLPNIGNGLTASTILPVVNTSGTATTDKTTVGNIANLTLTQAGNTLPPAFLANLAYNVVNAAQPNITSVGTLTGLSINNINNLHIPGGINGYVLQTDGAGNLDWTAQSGGGGNGTPGGANSQLQFNDSGDFGGSASLTWNSSNNILNTVNFAASHATVYGNIDTVTLNASGNIVPNAIYTNHYFLANGVPFTGNYGNANVVSLLPVYTGNISANIISATKLKGLANANLLVSPGNAAIEWIFTETGSLVWPGPGDHAIGSTANSEFELHSENSIIISTDVSNANSHFTFGADGIFVAPSNVIFNGTRLDVGPDASLIPLTNPTLNISDIGNTFVQAAITNFSAFGSADWVAYGNASDENQGWADIGFASVGFNDSNYTITSPGDGYFILQSYDSEVANVGGNLVIATGVNGTARDIVFATGGFLLENEFGRINNDLQQFHIKSNTDSISTTTGALRVDGGVGVSGNVYADKFYGDASGLTNVALGSGIANVLSSVTIPIANGNVFINTAGDNEWIFGDDGGTIFPQQNVQRGDNPSGTISGQTLLFGDRNQEAIISTPDGVEGNEYSQRLVINPGAGSNFGEGGDIYLWAGRGGDASGSGGDIKIRGGQGGANSNGGTGGDGGYIRMEAGDAASSGGQAGYIEITAGTGGPGNEGGFIDITGGVGAVNGGGINITGGYAQNGPGGDVHINGGQANDGLASYGNVVIASGTSTWTFTNQGDLNAPGNLSLNGGTIHSGTPTVIDANAAITAITLGTTVIVTFEDNIFFAPFRGSVLIFGITTTTQANGTWSFEAVEGNGIMLFTDDSYATPVDGTSWTPFLTQEIATNVNGAANQYFVIDNASAPNFLANVQVGWNALDSESTARTVIAISTDTPDVGQTEYQMSGGSFDFGTAYTFNSPPSGAVTITVDATSGNLVIDSSGYRTVFTEFGDIILPAGVDSVDGNGYSSISTVANNDLRFNISEGDNVFILGKDGNLTLPNTNDVGNPGGSIYSMNAPVAGNMIVVNPWGSGSESNQKLMIYPTAADGDHLHMVTGNLYQSELFLGNDDFYMKLANTGNIVINSNDGAGSSGTWTFDTTGNLTLPTISLGEGLDEQTVIQSQRKIIPPYRYSVVIDGATPTIVYIAGPGSLTLKTTIVVQHDGLGLEMFDVSAVAAGANVIYTVSNRLNATGQPDTTAVVDWDSLALAITLTVNSGATTSWVTYDSTEFGISVD